EPLAEFLKVQGFPAESHTNSTSSLAYMLMLLSGMCISPHTAPMNACRGAASVGDLTRSITHPPAASGFTAAYVAAASKPGCGRCRILVGECLLQLSRSRSNICPVAAPTSTPCHFVIGRSASSNASRSDSAGVPEEVGRMIAE